MKNDLPRAARMVARKYLTSSRGEFSLGCKTIALANTLTSEVMLLGNMEFGGIKSVITRN